VAPEGMRAGRDWVPEGGAGERLDRMPRWVRLWSKDPFRSIGDVDGWLWDHGGYDVEGPEAVAKRERRDARFAVAESALHSAMLAALDGTGPWPRLSSARSGSVTVVDVDFLGEYAVVLAATDGEGSTIGEPMLENRVFHRAGDAWIELGGGAGGSGEDPLLAREAPYQSGSPLWMSGSGGTYLEPEQRRGSVLQHAEVLCAPDVARVEIDKSDERRVADVSSGPGWLIVLWLKGDEPTLTAFDADGRQLDALRPETLQRERDSRGRSRWPWRSRGPRGRIVTIDDPILNDLDDRRGDAETVEEHRAIREKILARLRELNDDRGDSD
jgi:hypothetical protein